MTQSSAVALSIIWIHYVSIPTRAVDMCTNILCILIEPLFKWLGLGYKRVIDWRLVSFSGESRFIRTMRITVVNATLSLQGTHVVLPRYDRRRGIWREGNCGVFDLDSFKLFLVLNVQVECWHRSTRCNMEAK